MDLRFEDSRPHVISGRSQYWWRRRLLPWLFLAPILILNIVVVLAPSIGSAGFAFTDWSGLGKANFIGLENFKRMIGDRVFRIAFTNNVKYALIFLTVPIFMGLLGSALLAPIKRFQVVFRVGYFLPYVIATVVNVNIWRNILHPTVGVGAALARLGLNFMDVVWLGDRRVVLYTIAFVDNWHWWGFLLVLYLAAMQGASADLYEAAQLDGANRWQEWKAVTLPAVLPTLIFTILMTIIWCFLVFDWVYLTTGGGPAHASEVLATLVFTSAFERFEAGYAGAIGLTMGFVSIVVILAYNLLKRKGWEI